MMKQVEDDKILHEIISSLKNHSEGYIDGSWEEFQKKREQKKKKRKAFIIFLSGGIAATLLLCFMIHSTHHPDLKPNSQTLLRTEDENEYRQEIKSENKASPHLYVDSIPLPGNKTVPRMKRIGSRKAPMLKVTHRPGLVLVRRISLDKQHSPEINSELTAPADSSKISVVLPQDTVFTVNHDRMAGKSRTNKSNPPKISFGLVLKESTNSTPTSSNVSFALGIVNEVQLNQKLSVSSGVILDRYDLNYKHDRVYSKDDPVAMTAGLLCLDIPLNLNRKLAEMKQGDVFISGGISSLVFIRERYKQEYVFGAPTETTINFSNINFAGQLNLSGGWQYHLSGKMKITVGMYLKVPLYKLAEEDLRFYQSGITLKISR